MIQTKIQKTLILFNSSLLVDEYNQKNWDECFELNPLCGCQMLTTFLYSHKVYWIFLFV